VFFAMFPPPRRGQARAGPAPNSRGAMENDTLISDPERLGRFMARRVGLHLKYPEEYRMEIIERRLRRNEVEQAEGGPEEKGRD